MELSKVKRQQVTVAVDGEQIVSDAGVLPIHQLDQELGMLFEAHRRLPDLRSQLFVQHLSEHIIIQQVDQILVGYPDGNDSQLVRDDPLFKTTVGIDPREEIPLDSTSPSDRPPAGCGSVKTQAVLGRKSAIRCQWSMSCNLHNADAV